MPDGSYWENPVTDQAPSHSRREGPADGFLDLGARERPKRLLLISIDRLLQPGTAGGGG